MHLSSKERGGEIDHGLIVRFEETEWVFRWQAMYCILCQSQGPSHHRRGGEEEEIGVGSGLSEKRARHKERDQHLHPVCLQLDEDQSVRGLPRATLPYLTPLIPSAHPPRLTAMERQVSNYRMRDLCPITGTRIAIPRQVPHLQPDGGNQTKRGSR